MNTREMSVSGSFYPADAGEIRRYIDHFNQYASEENSHYYFDNIKAIIVPHAGWIYSGYTANLAFRIQKAPKRYIVIGPSHRVGFDGVSISDMDKYATPLGDIMIDQEIVQDYRNRFGLDCYPKAHHEHSTEVQMPFIRHYSPSSKVVELVYAYANPQMIIPLIEYALTLDDTVVVISTDLSHFHTLKQANDVDALCLEAIKNEDTKWLERGCEACGIIGVEAMLIVAKKTGLKSQVLDYRTSADASGDESRVVGYTSAVFY